MKTHFLKWNVDHLKQKLLYLFIGIVALPSLMAKEIPLPDFPPKEVIQKNIRIENRHAFSNDTEVILSKKTVLQQSKNRKTHQFSKPEIKKELEKGVALTLLDGTPWILSVRGQWKAWFYCKTPAGEGFVSSTALLFRPYQDHSTVAGIKLIPTLFPERNCVALRLYFDCTTKDSHFSIPIHQIDEGIETKIIPDQISLRDADKDGQIDFILSGTLFHFNIGRDSGTLSDAQAWISFREKKLIWVYTWENEILYPVDQKYQIKTNIKKRKGSDQIISIEKVVTRIEEKQNSKNITAIRYSNTNLTTPPPRSNMALEKPLFFPASGRITDDYLRLRKGPSLKDEVITLLRKGNLVTVINLSDSRETVGKNRDYWYQVRTAKGQNGWVFGSFLEILQGNG